MDVQIWATWRNQREITVINGSREQITAHQTLTLIDIDGDYSSTYSDSGLTAHWQAYQDLLNDPAQLSDSPNGGNR